MSGGVCVIAFLKHEQASSCGKDGGLHDSVAVLVNCIVASPETGPRGHLPESAAPPGPGTLQTE